MRYDRKIREHTRCGFGTDSRKYRSDHGYPTGTSTNQHAANSTMNRAAGDVATSSQDAQKQMQAQPTAAQQAQGAKSTDQGC